MKTLNQPTVLRSISATALAVGLALGHPAWASEKPSVTHFTDKETVTQYKGWEDPVMGNIAVNSGRALLQHLQAVKAALDSGAIDEARSQLISSRDFADALERMMPYVEISDDILGAKNNLVSDDKNIFYESLLPIYASLDEMEIYAPHLAKKARTKVQQAEKQAKKGDRKSAAKTMQEVADDISVTHVFLPVRFVDGQIHAALNAVTKKTPDVATAKKAISNALDNLTQVTLNTDATS